MIEKFSFFEPERCLVNLSNSVTYSFGLKTFHSTLSVVDSVLERKPRNTVILLLDGLGRNILERHLSPKSFLRSHLIEYYSSVFPPTTVAATTSILSGKFPMEHGRLGWDMYFQNENNNVSLFPNTISGTKQLVASYNVAWRYFPYDSLIARIQEAGFHAYFSACHEVPHPKNFSDVLSRTKRLCRLPQRKFIYAYYEQPDGLQHWKGTDSVELIDELQRIDEQLKDFVGDLEDTTLIITADHGHVDIQGVNLSEHPELTDCFLRSPSLEARAMNFFIREGKHSEFVQRFHEIFGDKDFLLLEMREVLSMNLFGQGMPHAMLKHALGDYLAIALSNKALFINGTDFKGHHSGMTCEEFEIPLIIVEV